MKTLFPRTYVAESVASDITPSDLATSIPEISPIRDDSQDVALMTAIQHRQPEALNQLFERYKLLLKSVILRIVHDHAAADDVMQECMVEIWTHASAYSAANGKPLGWICTMCKRRAIDYTRRQQTYSNAKGRFEVDLTANAEAPFQDGVADCEQADLSRVLNEQLNRLPDAQQEVIRLAFLEGMSQREVAAATHCPLGTVKTRMELGLRKLRASMNVIRSSAA